MNKKSKFPYLIGFSALLVAFASAFFSVFGLSQLFAGAKTQVIFMAGSLEFAKLVLASFLYRYWTKVNKAMKTYMSIAVFVLMLITSGGIYGYLSSAYQDTATKYEKRGNEIVTLNQRKSLDSLDMVRLQDRYNKLTDLRKTQETRLDTLYNRKQNNTAKRTEDLINKTNNEISQLDSSIRAKNDKINEINSEILSLNSENISGEIGPLKYLSDLTGLPMNKVVNIFILLLIFVFDPLAVTMIIGANLAFKQNEEIVEENSHHEEPISKMWSWFKKKPKEVVLDGGDFDLGQEDEEIKEQPMIKSEEKPTMLEVAEKTLDEALEKETTESIEKIVENQKEMPEEFVDAINKGYWDLINDKKEESIVENKTVEESIDIDEMFDSIEKQIEENRNEDEIVAENVESDGLNIYGEDVKETPKINEEPSVPIENGYTSIIQNPPPSAYSPGGGIKIK